MKKISPQGLYTHCYGIGQSDMYIVKFPVKKEIHQGSQLLIRNRNHILGVRGKIGFLFTSLEYDLYMHYQ